MTYFKISKDNTGEATRLVLGGELDLASEAEFDKAVYGVLGAKTVIVDCRQLTFCDSSGVHMLVRAQRRARLFGTDIRLVHVSSFMHQVLSVCGVVETLTSPTAHHGDAAKTPQ